MWSEENVIHTGVIVKAFELRHKPFVGGDRTWTGRHNFADSVAGDSMPGETKFHVTDLDGVPLSRVQIYAIPVQCTLKIWTGKQLVYKIIKEKEIHVLRK